MVKKAVLTIALLSAFSAHCGPGLQVMIKVLAVAEAEYNKLNKLEQQALRIGPSAFIRSFTQGDLPPVHTLQPNIYLEAEQIAQPSTPAQFKPTGGLRALWPGRK